MTKKATIWLIDDDDSIRWVLDKALSKAGFNTEIFSSADDALEHLRNSSKSPNVIVTDIRMPGTSGLDLLKKLHSEQPETPVIIMTAHTDLDSAVDSYDQGAFEYLPKPFDINDAIDLVERAVEHARTQKVSIASPDEQSTLIIGEAPAMQDIFRAIGRLSQSDLTVLVSGESGTGKELVAESLHQHSPRCSGPFIAINTGAIPGELIESELFGHEKGAFTGALAQHKGRFEQAEGGTLFLDEIGDMPPDLQIRLLRVLSEGRFFRVGGHKEIKVNVRIIAATNQDLEKRVNEGRFREDLFHRLNVVRLRIPSLHERTEDIPQLLAFFLKRTAKELNVEEKQFTDKAMNFLSSLQWPGNVRQLENTCRWLSVMAPSKQIRVDDLPQDIREKPVDTTVSIDGWQDALRLHLKRQFARDQENILKDLGPEFERILIETALEHTGRRKIEAARLLGWGRNTLTRKLKELSIEV
ncbi:MAG TPA: nitrogen regulation protein NR(I) [Gammaproteobacteria bacterium]|nr:nitrogen regulation protein NR(I) [Gammaproteobacteria bacterium]